MPDQPRMPPELFAAALADRYRFEGTLGRGGSAAVYLARDLKHGRRVAIKVLDAAAARAAAAARFQREIALVAQLQHPHVLPLHDSGEAAGHPYFVMPYVAGESLRARLRAGGALLPADALRVAVELADALAHAHAAGVVHRDVKPENVLLTEAPGDAWHALLADFGIARLTDPDTGPARHVGDGVPARSSAGNALGTIAYMAPEQADGDPALGPPADVFALGLVLYEMLTGVLPYADVASAPEALRLRLTGPPARLGGRAPRLPRRAARMVDAVLERAMAPSPGARFPTAAEMVGPLRAAQSAAAERVPGPFASRRARWATAVGALALVAIAFRAAAAVRDHWAEGSRLDPELVLVPPFADERVDAASIDGRDAEQLLLEAMGRWTDLRLVNATRVNDAVARTGRRAPRTLDEALALARQLGAGRLAWGTVGRVPGAPGQSGVRAALYNVARPNGALREHRVTVGEALPDLTARFGELADSLLFGDAESRAAVPGAQATTSLRAWRAYDRGHAALAAWDLDGAARAFGEAMALDPSYALAARWRAQAYAWMADPPRAAWRDAAARAVALPGRLVPADSEAARALLALAEGRYLEACAGYRGLLARDSLDYAAWYGLGDCQARDSVVLRDPSRPNGWRFRSSYRAAIAAYQQALVNLPSVHLAYGDAAVTYLPRLLMTGDNQWRRGVAMVGGVPLQLAALPSLDADTLAFVPYPLADHAAFRPWTDPPTKAAAIQRNREVLLDIAGRWAAAFPRSPAVLALRALADESLGRLVAEPGAPPAALELLRAARGVAGADRTSVERLALGELRVLVKLERFDAARMLADSLLAGDRAPTPGRAALLAVAAALTGRAAQTADLLRVAAADQAALSPDDVPPLDRAARAANAAGLAFAALGAPVDSVRAARVRAVALLAERAPADAADAGRRARFAAVVAMFAFPTVGGAPPTAPNGRYLLELQAAAARGDRDAVRDQLRALAARRASVRAGVVAVDAAYLEAGIEAWVGDTAAAVATLDATLTRLPLHDAYLLVDVPRAGAVGRAIAFRAALGGSAAGAPGARRWIDAAGRLWAGADPSVRAAAGALPSPVPIPQSRSPDGEPRP